MEYCGLPGLVKHKSPIVFTVFIVVDDIASGDIPKADKQPTLRFSQSGRIEEADLLGNELSSVFCQKPEHLQVHSVVEIKHHAISSNQDAIMLPTNLGK